MSEKDREKIDWNVDYRIGKWFLLYTLIIYIMGIITGILWLDVLGWKT